MADPDERTPPGADLAMLCGVRYAAEDSRFLFPFPPKVGLGPDYCVSWTLPRLVGFGHASRLLMSAADCPAEEAFAISLSEKVCAPDALLDDARELIGQTASIAPFGVRLAKTARRRSSLMGFAAAVDAEFGVQHLAMTTEDHRNAIAAFAEKRPPSYENR